MVLRFLRPAKGPMRIASKQSRQHDRLGAAAIEVVMVTAVSFTAAAFLTRQAIQVSQNLYHTIANLVGWPFL
jgi:hypothetical protein